MDEKDKDIPDNILASNAPLGSKTAPDKEISDTILAANITLRSEVVQEILSAPPSWMLKWGITIVFLVIVISLFFSWLIKYPDVIVGQLKITTLSPPVQQVSYTSGKIIALNKKNNEKVKKNETIAIIENLLTNNTSKAIHKYVDSIRICLRNPKAPLPIASDTLIVSGELEPDFTKLISLVKIYRQTVTDTFYRKSINNLQTQISQYNELALVSTEQIKLSKQDFENTLTKYKANKQLYKNGAITKFDFITEESKYISAQGQVYDLEKMKIQNLITLTDYENQLNNLKFQHVNKLFETAYSLYEVMNNIKNQLQQWEQQYVIKAPFDGTLSYLNSWATNAYVKQGETMFTVVPYDQEYIGLALVPSSNFGKIEIGQTANLRIDNYAYNEFGILIGKVKSITLVPGGDSNYRIEISLENGLLSTHKKQFDYKPDMTGTAQIITKDLSILERIFYQFKQLISR